MEGRASRNRNIKRWDGAARACTAWDSLRRDPELWYRNGNCFVHLYGRGHSRRGPSFKVPLAPLLAARCHPLINRYLCRDVLAPEPSAARGGDDDDLWGRPNRIGNVELYIPPPPLADPEQAHQFRLNARNFFAWVYRRSMVGETLSAALTGLMETMSEFRSPGVDVLDDVMAYLDEEGYLDMANQPIHALAILRLADRFQLRDLYINAFAHCVGMVERLSDCADYHGLDPTTRRLLRRARADMDAKLARAALVMRDFLSDDLPESDMGFGPGARAHLDRFRTFLRAFYTFRLDQYPPPLAEDKGGRWDAEVYQGMRDDFEALYEYLVDDSFSTAKSGLFVAQPGIDALRCVTTFDLLHRYPSLPNPLPLLPRPTFSAETRRSSWLGRQDKLQPDRRLVAQAALAKAANTTKAVAMRNSLVIAYRRFEEDSVSGSRKIRRKDKLSLSDARKLRWILIYAIVQTLRSCTDAPAEVRDAKAAKYSLAVSATHLPPWEQAAYCASSPRPACETGSRVSGEDARFGSEPMTFVSRSLPLLSTSTHAAYEPETLSPQMPLFPRAQATPEVSSRSRAASVMGRWSRPMSLRLGWFRNQSIDDVGEPKKRRFTHLEIVVRGYGNGVRKTPPAQTEVVELRPMTAPCPFPATASASECSTTPSETECSTTTRGSDVSSATTPLSEHLPGSWSPFHDGLPPAARCCTSGADSPACSSIYSTDGPMPAPYLEPLDDAGQTRPDNKTDDDHDDDDLDSNADVDSLDLNMDVPAPLLPRRSSARPLSPTAAAPREIRVELGDLQPSPLRIRKERGRVVVGPDCDDARTSTDGTL